MYYTAGPLEAGARNIANVEHVGHPMWQIVACRLLFPCVYDIKNMNTLQLSVAIETITVSAVSALVESVS